MKITTDHKFRDLISWNDLPEKAQKDFDYIKEADADDLRFVCYKGEWVDAVDTQRLCLETSGPVGWEMRVAPDSPLATWHSTIGDSFFSGLVFRFDREFERVVVGRYVS